VQKACRSAPTAARFRNKCDCFVHIEPPVHRLKFSPMDQPACAAPAN
jgi:hypothetical protein